MLATKLNEITGIPLQEISKLIRKPPNNGTYGEDEPDFCCFLKPIHDKIGNTGVENLLVRLKSDSELEKVVLNQGYLNFWLASKLDLAALVNKILQDGDNYGKSDVGQGETIVIDYSSPNIAKPFHVGHLRSTIIGNFLRQILSFLNYKVVGINYLGDWGKQYGLLGIAYNKYGNDEQLKINPLSHLLDLYIKINKDKENESRQLQHLRAPEPIQVDTNNGNKSKKKAPRKRKDIIVETSYDRAAKDYFRRLEAGEDEVVKQWQNFRTISIEASQKLYHRLGVQFDVYSGESQVNPKLWAENLKVQINTDCSKFVELGVGLGKALMAKKDGSSLYLSRDVSACIERIQLYNPKQILYVVGQQQKVHFEKLFKLMSLTEFKSQLEHIGFGQIKGMSTRQGSIILLEDVLNEARARVLASMTEKSKLTQNTEEVADLIGVSCVIINDLSYPRLTDVAFDWKKVLSFEGHTGAYLQYTHARLSNIITPMGVEVSNSSPRTNRLHRFKGKGLVPLGQKFRGVWPNCSRKCPENGSLCFSAILIQTQP